MGISISRSELLRITKIDYEDDDEDEPSPITDH